MFIVAQKPSSDTHQWWNDPLEDRIKRVPSGNTNPFVGERTVESNSTDRLARSTTMPATRRPTPPPPSSIKKPVDLLGGKFSEHLVHNLQKKPITYHYGTSSLDADNFDAPVLGSKATGIRQIHDAKSSSLNIKRTAPPPPPGRKFTPLPASSSVIPKDQIGSRRPAPPPPRKTGLSKGDTDDDTDDDTNDDTDNDDDSVDASSSVRAKDQETSVAKGTDHAQEMQETLLKPSALKKDAGSGSGPGSKSTPVAAVSRGTKPVDTSATNASLASVAANKSKALLPGDVKRPVALGSSTSSVASLGLAPGSVRQFNSFSNKAGSSSNELKAKQDEENAAPPSVSALKKSFGVPSLAKDEMEDSSSVMSELKKSYGVSKGDPSDDGPPLSVAALKKSYGTKTTSDENPMAAAISERKKSYGVAKSTDNEDEPVPSVSELKKSYGTTATKDDVEVAPSVSELKKSYGVTSGSTKDPEEAPTVATLTKSFGTKGIITPQPVGPSAGASSSPVHVPAHGPKMVKMAGLGSVQSGMALKGSVLSGGNTNKVGVTHHDHKESNGAKTKSKDKDSEEDVMPASGSVKNAIAALKGTPTGAGEAKEEEKDEEDKVDAFAFWKSK